jgi:chloramphenicol 3-O-phosphotransferase
VIVVTGIQAAGKSAIAQALAERLDRSVHLRGDVFRRMIVSGRAEMGPADPPAEAIAQLRLRHKLAGMAADGYANAGFTVVLQDIIIGSHLADMVAAIRSRPLYVVVLAPRADIVQARDQARQLARGKLAYKPGDQSPAELDAAFRQETPRIGLWLDTSTQTVTETVEEILSRFQTEAEVGPAITGTSQPLTASAAHPHDAPRL